MGRVLVFIYGVGSYFIGVAGLLAIIAAYAGFMPFGFLNPTSIEQANAIAVNALLVNVLLIIGWSALHTGMARQGFKDAITRIIPEPTERATYVLVAGITSIILVGYWQPVSGQVWLVESRWAVIALWSGFAFGWAFLLAATFAINHFDLFGLRQVYHYLQRRTPPPLQFVRRAMYKYVRHPIQTGVLIGIWVTPNMTADRFLLSVGFTLYIFAGLWFEERDLIKHHGVEYQQYRDEVGKLFPKIR